MYMDKRKFLLSFFVLGSLLVSLALAFNMFGTGMQHSFAQSPGVTVTDFCMRGGQEPWGTTFDSNGQCVGGRSGVRSVADLQRNDSSGRIEEYNPATSSWIATYALPVWLRPAAVPRV